MSMNSEAGKKFGLWEVLQQEPTLQNKGVYLACKCCCGTIRLVNKRSLVKGKSKSCGCQRTRMTPTERQERNRAAGRRYYQRNKSKRARYQKNNRLKYKKYRKDFYERHKARMQEYYRDYAKKERSLKPQQVKLRKIRAAGRDRDKTRIRNANYRAKNRDRLRAYMREYYVTTRSRLHMARSLNLISSFQTFKSVLKNEHNPN